MLMGRRNGKNSKRKRKQQKRRTYIPKDRYISKYVRSKVMKRDKYKCVYCNRRRRSWRMKGLRPKRVKLEYGHIIPHSKGGDRCVDNIQMECFQCNRSKGATQQSLSWMTKLLGRGADGCKKHHE